MANHTQIRLVQVTGSVVDFKPAAIVTGVASAAFGANDLSGSLQYFAQAISNIHGNVEFGGQTRGLIQAPNGSDYDLKLHQLDAGQSIHLDSDGTVADAIDIDSAGGMDVDVTGVLDINAGDDSVIKVTTADKHLTLGVSGGGTQYLQLDSAGTGAGAIGIAASAGGIDIDAAAAIDILAATTMTIKGAGVSKYGDDVATLDFDGAGAVSETGMTDFTVTPSATLTMQGAGVSKYGDDVAYWNFDGVGAASEVGMTSLTASPSAAITLTAGATSVWSASAGDLTVDSAAGILTLNGGVAGAGAVTIEADNAAGGIDVDAGTGGIAIDTTGAFSVDGAAASNISVVSGGADENLTLSVTGATASSLILSSAGTGDDAIDINSTAGGIDVDSASLIEVESVANMHFTTSGAAGDILLSSAHTAGVAFHIDANANAASEVQIDAGILDIDVTAAATLDAVGIALGAGSGELDLTTTGLLDVNCNALTLDMTDSSAITITSSEAAEDLTIAQVGANDSSIIITAAGTGPDAIKIAASGGGIDMDSGGDIDINSGGGFSLDGMGVDSNVSLTTDAGGQDLTIALVGGTDSSLVLSSAGTGTDAIDVNATAGGLDVDVALGCNILAGAASSFLTADDFALVLGAGTNDASHTMIRLVHDSGTVTNEKILVQNQAGTTGDAIKLNAKAGGVWISATTANSDAINIDATAGGIEIDAVGIVDIESSNSDIKIGTDDVDRAIAIGTAGTRAISLGSGACFVGMAGSSMTMSGSARMAMSGSVTLSSDGSMTSGDAGGMAFAGYNEFATFRAHSIFSASTTVVGALNTLASNITGATATIFTGSLAADVAAGGNVTVDLLSGDNATLVKTVGDTKAQVFVNGQLLVSSSIGGTNDYMISATDTLQFQFALKTGDMVMVIDRS
jgi:hypothetical protein